MKTNLITVAKIVSIFIIMLSTMGINSSMESNTKNSGNSVLQSSSNLSNINNLNLTYVSGGFVKDVNESHFYING